jgi:hypothetical protein
VASALKPLIALAKSDTAEALRRARSQPLPANRCQFLAWVARFAPDGEVVSIANEALAASALVDDPYWSVAIAAWALRALVERGHDKECRRALHPVLERAQRIAHPVCRMDALEILLHAVFAVAQARGGVLHLLVPACKSASTWKAPRCLSRTAVLLARAAPSESALVLAALGDGKYKRQALREIAAGGGEPRSFFW